MATATQDKRAQRRVGAARPSAATDATATLHASASRGREGRRAASMRVSAALGNADGGGTTHSRQRATALPVQCRSLSGGSRNAVAIQRPDTRTHTEVRGTKSSTKTAFTERSANVGTRRGGVAQGVRGARPSGRGSTTRGAARPALPAEPVRAVKIKELDPLVKCGPATSVQHLFRVEERDGRASAFHLVFFDRHGWYCEHGRGCRAVDDLRARRKEFGLTI